ncbi:BrnA antitoxin family protein [Lentibacter sp.]|uniref:BrnA antitoxin family protein n=1 Tax=Lentibacter sp. TaxID=2024994 RepID=UPI003F69A279
MPRMTKDRARITMFEELKILQEDLRQDWVNRSLPKEWNGSISAFGYSGQKEKISIRLDADMLKWFRSLGPGYQAKINTVLRIYWTALITGMVRAHYDDTQVTPLFEEMIQRKIELSRLEREERMRDMGLEPPPE